ncbi:MAG TPA: YfiR family protein [bacterium]|nr:YfiR family protein [bacterium]HPN43057.1 YfiR family protein [bacterium]
MRRQIILLLLFCSVLIGNAISQISEYSVKAVYLERFTRFMQWPSNIALEDTTQEFILGVIGDNPFENKLEEIYTEQKIKNKKVKLVYYQNVSQIEECHLLFIARTDNDKLFKILSYCSNKPILTVSDTGGFGGYGVHINFYISDNKVKFEINEKALHKAGLKCSYLLLKSARIINPVGGF